MLLRIMILVVGAGYVAYRIALAVEIIKATRAGDVAREQRLRTRGFGLYRWLVLGVLVFIALLTVVVWLGER